MIRLFCFVLKCFTWMAEKGGGSVANANITKQALASALKELLEETPFEKISVGSICERCGMNRKSFYYHFKDKYELITWVYDMEFLSVMKEEQTYGWDLVEKLCVYFYESRSFYQKTFCIEGQNSFSNYLEGVLSALVEDDLDAVLDPGQKDHMSFYVAFYVDAFLCSIRRWVLEDETLGPQEFAAFLRRCLIDLPVRSNAANLV
ncbi:MAG: TetR/AcrR family transcriptional regulator C-terminal domain-containing protein [Eggerthellaceae bacterium]